MTVRKPTSDGTYLKGEVKQLKAESQQKHYQVALLLKDSNLVETVAESLGKYMVAAGKQWRQWDGKRWADINDAQAQEIIRLTLKELYEEIAVSPGVSPDEAKAVSVLLTLGKITAVHKLLAGMLYRSPADFDLRHDLLNTPTGVVDLRTGELLEHDYRYWFTKITVAGYIPGATHADWNKALEAIPEETRGWLQIKMGQALTGYTPDDDIMPILHGAGSNGKSVILGAVQKAAGQFAVALPERLLLANPGDHPTELMMLQGARLAIMEETPEGRRLNTKRLKDVLGQPTITARHLYGNNVTFQTTHSLFISSNYLLQVAETDWGTWRRLALVSFPFKYVTGKPDVLKNERAGDRGLRSRLYRGSNGRGEAVLAWLVAGACQWYAAKRVMPGLPKLVSQDTEDWRGESDPILRFVEECLLFGADQFTSSADLFRVFNSWLKRNNFAPWSIETFSNRFSTHDVVRDNHVAQSRRRLRGGNPVRGWDLVGVQATSWVMEL